MRKAVWKVDDEERAIYVDLEGEDNEYVEEPSLGKWAELPDLVIEKILSHLTIQERYYASLVCRRWYQAFHLPYVWSTFILEDRTLSRRKFNYYMGWQYTLDHIRAQIYLYKSVKNVRHLIFSPMYNFFNLFEFMTMLSHYADRYPGSLKNIHSLKYTFSCDMASRSENAIYGTGGKLLEAVKELMSKLPGLNSLELINLLLDTPEALHLLNDVCDKCCLTLRSLSLINTTKLPCQLLHAGVFLNLRTLYISPQNLGPDLIWLISSTKLQHLHIVQNAYTEAGYGADAKAWTELVKINSSIKVHLQCDGKTRREIIWQEKAPVASVLYDSPYSQVITPSILSIVDLYRFGLRVYGHKGLPRFHTSKSFQDRIDSSMLLLVRQCPNLHTLVTGLHRLPSIQLHEGNEC